jgi:hypothetical protein
MNTIAALTSPSVVADDSQITIRGVRLRFDELVDERQFLHENALKLREQLLNAKPFEHVVAKGLFNDRLLELVYDEFDMLEQQPLTRLSTKYEETRRSAANFRYGPASQIYFWLVNSSLFTNFLGTVTGVDNLLSDPTLWSGGLHETRNGGRFEIHRDFNAHIRTGLHNVMVFITYLNKDWLPSYNGALELWDESRQQCVTKVPPDFGSSLIMRHGSQSYHGYTTPLNIPPGRTRRSVACYYYSNRADIIREAPSTVSKFLHTAKEDVARDLIKQFIPPILWTALKKLKPARRPAPES